MKETFVLQPKEQRNVADPLRCLPQNPQATVNNNTIRINFQVLLWHEVESELCFQKLHRLELNPKSLFFYISEGGGGTVLLLIGCSFEIWEQWCVSLLHF